jgi:cation diffusion facilitator family transporter
MAASRPHVREERSAEEVGRLLQGPVDAARLARRVAGFSVIANLVLSIANLRVGAGSAAARAAGVEFGADVVAALSIFFGLWYAARPADSNHPYGHGRAETVTGLLLGVFLILTGGVIGLASFRNMRFTSPPPGAIALVPLAGAIVVKSIMMWTKVRLGRRISSSALEADGWNDSVDVLSAMAATIALGLALYDPQRFLIADHVGGVIVGLFVVFAGLRVVRHTMSELIDTMPPEELMDQVRRVALAVPGVSGVEKCFGRKTGLAYHIDLHLEVDETMTVRDAHDVATDVRFAIVEALPEVTDVLVHVEPAQRIARPAGATGRAAERR